MKRKLALLISISLSFLLAACSGDTTAKTVYDNGYRTYYKLSDGTWKCEDHIYRYRFELNGRLPNAAKDSTFVYLSNMESISFEQAWKAAGLSSNTDDYFSAEDAVLVEMY